jgi:holin-like protein
MLEGIAILIVLQLAGEVIAGLTRIPVPGPVIGLGLLAAYALGRGALPGHVEQAGDALLKHLSLLFVPAGVGLIAFGERLVQEGPRLVLVLIASTAITMIATAFIFRWLTRKAGNAPEEDI